MLVAVAVLAMLAFFVLPPFLQMGAGSSSADPVVVSWKGGAVREDQLERAVALRTLANRFLMQGPLQQVEILPDCPHSLRARN